MAQLTKLSISTPEDRGSNPVNSYFYWIIWRLLQIHLGRSNISDGEDHWRSNDLHQHEQVLRYCSRQDSLFTLNSSCLSCVKTVKLRQTNLKFKYLIVVFYFNVTILFTEYKPGPGAAEKIPGPVRSVVMLVFRFESKHSTVARCLTLTTSYLILINFLNWTIIVFSNKVW